MLSNFIEPQEEKRFYPVDTSHPRYGLIPPYGALHWLLDQRRFEDALVYWCQENGCLEFMSGLADLRAFEKHLSSSDRVSLKVAHKNVYIAKDMSRKVANLLLDLQRQGRIVIGRMRRENLKVIVEPDDGEPINYLRSAMVFWPTAIRTYKRPRSVDYVVRIYLGRNPWPQGNAPEYCVYGVKPHAAAPAEDAPGGTGNAAN
jgi:hypothetical protein